MPVIMKKKLVNDVTMAMMVVTMIGHNDYFPTLILILRRPIWSKSRSRGIWSSSNFMLPPLLLLLLLLPLDGLDMIVTIADD